MNSNLIILLTLLGGAALGALLMYLKAKADVASVQGKIEILGQDNETLKQKIDAEQAKSHELATLLTGAEKDLEHLHLKLKEQLAQSEQLQEKFTKEFENMANKILADNSQKFSEQNKESMNNILNPLKEKITDFEKKVESTSKESIDMNAALRQQIIGLQELNLQMSKEATNLTKALKGDSKKQGNWGELVLERVLEKSGLEKGREYDVQQNFQREDGSRVLPDVVIHLPDGKKMIIDSKVSLTAYEQYVNSEEEGDQARYLKMHIDSIKKHVDDLGDKNYQDLYQIESPNFVLMFIPIEPAFAIAINQDDKLYNKAFDKNIVIVTPSTLLATLRTIDTMWSNDKQQKNALEIAIQAGGLYDKFEGLMQDLVKVGKKIQETDGEYKNAMNKLFEGKGNLINRVEKLKKLGAKANKALPDNILDKAGEE
jgi:DNA recombination protein RmuC